jgi:hypothetical protein
MVTPGFAVPALSSAIVVGAFQRVPARTEAEVAGFFGDLTLVEPGLTDIWAWRPDGDTVTTTTEVMRILGGVAQKN